MGGWNVRKITYREALREALREEMQRDPTVFLLGEDIGKYWGGAFKVTEGLAEGCVQLRK
jgi:pyruvate/2-oxoglutarate/acetoin dehydrogenase E1 component